jgi:hypothetical protein
MFQKALKVHCDAAQNRTKKNKKNKKRLASFIPEV